MATRTRKKKHKHTNKQIIIYCEGFTEKHYFDMLKSKYSRSNITVKTESLGLTNQELVEKVIEKKKRNKSDLTIIVFDYDDNPVNKIEKSFKLARENNIEIWYSNKCFEVWLLLHFQNLKDQNLKINAVISNLEKYTEVENWKDYKNEKFEDLKEYFIDNVNLAYENANITLQGDGDICHDYSPFNIQKYPYTNIHFNLKKIFNVNKL